MGSAWGEQIIDNLLWQTTQITKADATGFEQIVHGGFKLIVFFFETLDALGFRFYPLGILIVSWMRLNL